MMRCGNNWGRVYWVIIITMREYYFKPLTNGSMVIHKGDVSPDECRVPPPPITWRRESFFSWQVPSSIFFNERRTAGLIFIVQLRHDDRSDGVYPATKIIIGGKRAGTREND